MSVIDRLFYLEIIMSILPYIDYDFYKACYASTIQVGIHTIILSLDEEMFFSEGYVFWIDLVCNKYVDEKYILQYISKLFTFLIQKHEEIMNGNYNNNNNSNMNRSKIKNGLTKFLTKYCCSEKPVNDLKLYLNPNMFLDILNNKNNFNVVLDAIGYGEHSCFNDTHDDILSFILQCLKDTNQLMPVRVIHQLLQYKRNSNSSFSPRSSFYESDDVLIQYINTTIDIMILQRIKAIVEDDTPMDDYHISIMEKILTRVNDLIKTPNYRAMNAYVKSIDEFYDRIGCIRFFINYYINESQSQSKDILNKLYQFIYNLDYSVYVNEQYEQVYFTKENYVLSLLNGYLKKEFDEEAKVRLYSSKLTRITSLIFRLKPFVEGSKWIQDNICVIIFTIGTPLVTFFKTSNNYLSDTQFDNCVDRLLYLYIYFYLNSEICSKDSYPVQVTAFIFDRINDCKLFSPDPYMNKFLLKLGNTITSNDCNFCGNFYDYIFIDILMNKGGSFYDLIHVRTLFGQYIYIYLSILFIIVIECFKN